MMIAVEAGKEMRDGMGVYSTGVDDKERQFEGSTWLGVKRVEQLGVVVVVAVVVE